MSLHQYEVDFSQLTLDERTVLMDRIEKNVFQRSSLEVRFSVCHLLC